MNIDLFIKEVEKLGLKVTSSEINQLEKYYELLIEWNEKMNLTAITEKEKVYLKHFYDSLTITKVIDLNEIDNLCDIGTGAGFPGIVLKIFFPDIEITLIDALNKRVKFLNEVIRKLNLKKIEAKHIRAEDYAKQNIEKYDLVTARAVSSMNILLEYSAPLIKINKYFVAMMGEDNSDKAKKALEVLNCQEIEKKQFKLPIEQSTRTIILIEKTKKTSNKYPRKFSEIKKRPL